MITRGRAIDTICHCFAWRSCWLADFSRKSRPHSAGLLLWVSVAEVCPCFCTNIFAISNLQWCAFNCPGLWLSYSTSYFDLQSLWSSSQVELDPAVVEVAHDWYGFPRKSDRLAIHVADGLDFVENLASQISAQKEPQDCSSSGAPASSVVQAPEPESELEMPECPPQQHAESDDNWTAKSLRCIYDVIVIDVDTKDASLGMSCPPLPFGAAQFFAFLKMALVTSQSPFSNSFFFRPFFGISGRELSAIVSTLLDCPSWYPDRQYCRAFGGTLQGSHRYNRSVCSGFPS